MRRCGARGPVRGWGRLLTTSVVLLAIAMAGGCSRFIPSIEYVAIWHPVWLHDGWVYHLREVSSEGRELWRQRPGKGPGKLVLDTTAPRSVCVGGVFDFLYESPGGDLGVAVECEGGTRTELLTYSVGRGQFESHASVSFLAGVALTDGEATGFGEVARDCGIAVQPLVAGKLLDVGWPVMLDGTTFDISGGDRDCGAVAWVRSPAVAGDGRLYFAVATDSLGKLPVMEGDALEGFAWRLVVWDERAGSARSLAEIPGVADLVVSPDGQTVIAAVSSPGKSRGVWAVDAATGNKSKIVDGVEAYHPSFSPDGSELVYVDGLRHLKFSPLPAG